MRSQNKREVYVTDGETDKLRWRRDPERLNECYTQEGLSWFQHSPKNALSESGSVALTPLSAYTSTLPLCHSHEGTMCLRARMADSERKYAIVRKCNPLTALEHPLGTPTCYIHTHACPPSSAARRHFRNSALAATAAIFAAMTSW